VQKLLQNPRRFERFERLLDRRIAELDCLVERAMKKKPKGVRDEEELKVGAGV
jgi:hypothetical protein